jgi:hypothetical protein
LTIVGRKPLTEPLFEREKGDQRRARKSRSLAGIDLQSKVHGRVRDGDNPGPPVEKGVANVLPNDTRVRLERVLRVETGASDRSFFSGEEARSIGTGRKEEEDDDGEEE